jgi:very-long-chain (3R)-3-hydroxyacyl-CoA dehydratase
MAPKQSTSTTSRKAKPSSSSSSVKNAYLLAYNALSAALWAGVLYQTVTLSAHEIGVAQKSGALFSGNRGVQGVLHGLRSGRVFNELENYTRLTQSLAGLEVLHSLLGVVRAPLLTTLMQVASRFLLVWGIAYNFPESTRHNAAYASMLFAWSFTEVVRYSYFVFALSGVGVPRLWTWLR